MAGKKKIERLPREIAGALADAFEKSVLTIDRWVESGEDLLTSEKAKAVFAAKGFVYDKNKYINRKLAKAV